MDDVPAPHPTTSVALCTCNGQRWIAQQLESILKQTRPVDEIVVSDDASEDSTVGIARRILERSSIPHRVLESGERQGFVTNFEKAVRHCSKEVVLFCDQDDLWEKTKVAILTSHLAAKDWAFSDAALIDSEDNPLPGTLFSHFSPPPSRASALDCAVSFLRRPSVTGATMAVRRIALERCLPFPATFPHDQWISLILSCCGSAPGICPAALVQYRIHPGQAIGLGNSSLPATISSGLVTAPQRYMAEASRCAQLADRLRQLGLGAEGLGPVLEKKRHMQMRAEMRSLPRISRIRPILAEMFSGRYRFSWTRGAALKDLLAPLTSEEN